MPPLSFRLRVANRGTHNVQNLDGWLIHGSFVFQLLHSNTLMFWSNKPPLQASSTHLDCSAKLSRQAKQSMRIEGHGPIVTNYPFSGVRKCTSTNYDLKNQAIPNHIIVWSVTPRKWIWMSPPQNEVIYAVWQPFFHWNSFCGLRSNFMHSLSLCIIMIADVGQRHLSCHIKNWIEISLSQSIHSF